MCGICGVYAYGQTEPALDEAAIASMRDRMAHRGPDGQGTYLSKDRRLGLGHRRLSIVDLSPAGAQPMTNEDGTLWIAFNGEIYNHQELRAQLEPRGHRYRSRSDTETLLHGYEEWGEGLLDRLEGDFAIAIWDEKTGELFLARDRNGVKPLYWAQENGRFLFASEAKAILAAPGFKADVDEEAFHRYLTFVAVPAPQTLFRGIQKLPAGTKLRVTKKGAGPVEPWWTPPVSGERRDGDYASLEAAEERLMDLLDKAVRKRLMSDVPFGVFLSGGIDSSLNVGLMSRAHNQPINTFTVGFKDAPELDERDWARKVATTFGANYHEILIDEDDMLRYLPSMVWHQDEPLGDCVCVPLYYVSKLLRDSGTIVVQVGEGSDEQFSGYWWSKAYVEFERRFQRSRLVGAFAGSFARPARALANQLGMDPFSLQHLERMGRGEEVFLGGCIALTGQSKDSVLGSYYRNGHRPAWSDASDVVRRGLEPLLRARPDASIADRMLFWELRARLPELLLMRVDKMTMQTSVEARVPFLDHKVVEFSSQLPLDWRLHNGETKYILKRVAAKVLPHDVVYRKKQGFGAPTTKWFRSKLGERFREWLRASKIRERGLLDLDHVERMLDQHRALKADYGFYLWVIMNAVLWYDRYIAGEPQAS
jgi:asparagine synthase (glutamine-hydrolysing)